MEPMTDVITCPRCGITYETQEDAEAITDWGMCLDCDKIVLRYSEESLL